MLDEVTVNTVEAMIDGRPDEVPGVLAYLSDAQLGELGRLLAEVSAMASAELAGRQA